MYRVGEIECDTPEEARALVIKTVKRKVVASQRKGISDSWKAARALAKKENISVKEARSKLAAKKR